MRISDWSSDVCSSDVCASDLGVEVLRRLQPHAAAVAAIAAIGPAERDELLAPETDAAVAAVSGSDGDFGFVDQFHGAGIKGMRGMKGMGSVRELTGTRNQTFPTLHSFPSPRNKKPRRSGASRHRGIASVSRQRRR